MNRVCIQFSSHSASTLVDVDSKALSCSLAVFGVDNVGAGGTGAPNVSGGYDKMGGGKGRGLEIISGLEELNALG